MGYPFQHSEEHIDDQMVKMEVNLDDMPAEWLGYIMDLLLEAGANDIFYSPIYMKKNRPGVLLNLMCEFDRVDDMKRILFSETTTFGIRYYPISVHRLERRFTTVLTKWGDITVKEGLYQGMVIQQSPEYEECKRIAKNNQVPLKQVYSEVWEKIKNI